MRPAGSAAQAIALRGTTSGAFGIHRPGFAARGAGLSKTCWVAASAGLSIRPACLRLSHTPPPCPRPHPAGGGAAGHGPGVPRKPGAHHGIVHEHGPARDVELVAPWLWLGEGLKRVPAVS